MQRGGALGIDEARIDTVGQRVVERDGASPPHDLMQDCREFLTARGQIDATGCVGIVVDGNYVWAAFVFGMLATSSNLGILLLAVIPSGILFYRSRRRTDLNSLLLAVGAFAVLLVEAALLNLVLPMRGE